MNRLHAHIEKVREALLAGRTPYICVASSMVQEITEAGFEDDAQLLKVVQDAIAPARTVLVLLRSIKRRERRKPSWVPDECLQSSDLDRLSAYIPEGEDNPGLKARLALLDHLKELYP